MFNWFPDWSGQVAVVVASGQSVSQVSLDVVRDRCRVLVVNSSFRAALWADVLYASDRGWWEHKRNRDAFEFSGLKIIARESIGKNNNIKVVNVKTINEADAHSLHLEPKGIIGHGGNSGFQGLNLALQFGSRKIVLVGFDMCGEHWHEKHVEPLRNPRDAAMALWRKRLDAQAARLNAMRVEVINASVQSALTAYPKMSVASALDHFSA